MQERVELASDPKISITEELIDMYQLSGAATGGVERTTEIYYVI